MTTKQHGSLPGFNRSFGNYQPAWPAVQRYAQLDDAILFGWTANAIIVTGRRENGRRSIEAGMNGTGKEWVQKGTEAAGKLAGLFGKDPGNDSSGLAGIPCPALLAERPPGIGHTNAEMTDGQSIEQRSIVRSVHANTDFGMLFGGQDQLSDEQQREGARTLALLQKPTLSWRRKNGKASDAGSWYTRPMSPGQKRLSPCRIRREACCSRLAELHWEEISMSCLTVAPSGFDDERRDPHPVRDRSG